MADNKETRCDMDGHHYEPARTFIDYEENVKADVMPKCITTIYTVYCTRCGKSIDLKA